MASNAAGYAPSRPRCDSEVFKPSWIQVQQPPMTTQDNTQHPDQEVQEPTDENLQEVSAGYAPPAPSAKSTLDKLARDDKMYPIIPL